MPERAPRQKGTGVVRDLLQERERLIRCKCENRKEDALRPHSVT